MASVLFRLPCALRRCRPRGDLARCHSAVAAGDVTEPPMHQPPFPADQPSRMVFMAGMPGSGKTTAINRLFGLQNVLLLDLDAEMRDHPQYDPDDRAAVYDLPDAYQWANHLIEHHDDHDHDADRSSCVVDWRK